MIESNYDINGDESTTPVDMMYEELMETRRKVKGLERRNKNLER